MARVCIFGDSITWGSTDPTGGWVARLYSEGLPRGVEVYNCGIPGNRIGDVATRFPAEATSRQPDAIVFAIGINDVPHDGYAGTALDVFGRAYQNMVERAQRMARDVLLVTPTNVDEKRTEHNYRNADIARIVELVERVASSNSLPCINVYGSLGDADVEPDGLHPGTDGHRKLYDAIAGPVFALASLRT